MTSSWLEIDIKGFAQILRNKGIARIALEPISNALDTEATEIQVLFNQHDRWASLTVIDDDPDGFADLREAYTMFAPSRRREDPTKRGRFGQGDKELIAICANGGAVEVQSTTGTILFGENGRTKGRRKTEAGTKLIAHFRCTKAEAEEFSRLVRSLIPPTPYTITDWTTKKSFVREVKLFFNGEPVERPEPVKVVRDTLATKIVDGEGNISDTRRLTDIELFEPRPGETATIYELGVPVVEHDGRWHINVMQKVPLNTARDNVTPAYLRKLRQIMLDETHDLLTSDDHKTGWVKDALPTATPQALRSHIESVYGKDAVIYDPSDTEAGKRAADKGWQVVYGGSFKQETWDRIKEHDILKPAGQVLPSGVPTSPDGELPIPRDTWTPDMLKLEGYTKRLGEHLLGYAPEVEFHNLRVTNGNGHTAAWWSGTSITFNLRVLGKQWPETASQVEVDDLILHEFAHDGTGHDHFTDRYINKLSRLGALLRTCTEVLR